MLTLHCFREQSSLYSLTHCLGTEYQQRESCDLDVATKGIAFLSGSPCGGKGQNNEWSQLSVCHLLSNDRPQVPPQGTRRGLPSILPPRDQTHVCSLSLKLLLANPNRFQKQLFQPSLLPSANTGSCTGLDSPR